MEDTSTGTKGGLTKRKLQVSDFFFFLLQRITGLSDEPLTRVGFQEHTQGNCGQSMEQEVVS